MMLSFPDGLGSSARHRSGLASSASGVASSRRMEGLLGAAPAGSLVAPVRLSAPIQCRATRSAGSPAPGHGAPSSRVRAQAAPSATGVSVTAAAAAALAAPPSESRQVLRGDGPAAGVLDSPEGALSADVGAFLDSAGDCCSLRHAGLGSSVGERLQEGDQETEHGTGKAEVKPDLWPSPLSLPESVEVSTAQEGLRREPAPRSSIVRRTGGPRKVKSASDRRQASKAQEPRAQQPAGDRWRRDRPRTKLLQRIEYEDARSQERRGQGRQDKSHTSAARALTFCLRGVQTMEEVGSIVRGAESSLSLQVISSCLSKLGTEGHAEAAVSLLQWLRTWAERRGVAPAGADRASQRPPDMAQAGTVLQETIAHEGQSVDIGGTTAEPETKASSETAGWAGEQGPLGPMAPNVFTYNAALGALRTNREWQRMDLVLGWMQEDGVPMDTVTLNTFLAAYLDLDKEDVAWDVLAKATTAAEPCPDLFTVRTMVPALLRWKPEDVAPAGAQGAHGPRTGAAAAPNGATAEQPRAEAAGSPEAVIPEGYLAWEAQWKRLQLLLRIFRGASEAVGVRQRESSKVVKGRAGEGGDKALAGNGGTEEAEGPASMVGAAGALSSPGLGTAPAGPAEAGQCASLGDGRGMPELPLQRDGLGLAELPSQGEGLGAAATAAPKGLVGSLGAGRGQPVQSPRQRRARQRQQQQEVEACLRMACSQMLRAVVVLHEQHCTQRLIPSMPQGPQPPSQLLPAGAAPAAAEVAGPGAAAKAEEAVRVGVTTLVAGSSKGHNAHESRSSASAVLEPSAGEQSWRPELEASAGARQRKALGAEDPRSRLWAEAAVAVAGAMADAGVRRDGPTFYWLLKALCLSPVAQQKRIRAGYRQMREQAYVPQLRLCHSILEALGTARHWWAALEVYEDMGRRGPQPTEETQALVRAQFNLLLNAARRRRIWKWALLLLQRMQAAGVAPDRRSWATALVTCATANATEAAVDVFRGMLDAGHQAGPREYGALLSALEKGRQWAQAEEVWQHMARVGVPPGLHNSTTMIAVLGAQGLYGRAVALFDEMCGAPGLEPDVATYNALISACAVAGEGTRAVAWIQKVSLPRAHPVPLLSPVSPRCVLGAQGSPVSRLCVLGAQGSPLSPLCVLGAQGSSGDRNGGHSSSDSFSGHAALFGKWAPCGLGSAAARGCVMQAKMSV